MSDHSQEKRRLQTAEQAAGWLLTLQSPEVTSQERAQFVDWLRESPVHVAELLRVSLLHRGLSKFNGWQVIGESRLPQESAVIRLKSREYRHSVTAQIGNTLTGRRKVIGLCAATALAVAALCMIVIGRLRQTVILTLPGDRSEITLADSSIVDLAPNTQLRVHYDSKGRFVMLDRGEALFNVAKNAKWPFVVEAGNTRVRAVGTSFDVGRGTSGVAVTVIEGKVHVAANGPPSSHFENERLATRVELSLTADEQVIISSSTGHATPIRKVDGQAAIEWTTGQLSFVDETVSEVVARFNHYNRTQIRVLDPAVATRRVSGTFRATDPESFAAFIQSVAGVTVVQQKDTILVGK